MAHSVKQCLAVAQCARRKDRVGAIHARIVRRHKDALHKLSTGLVTEHGAISVGNVNTGSLARTGMVKSVLDVG